VSYPGAGVAILFVTIAILFDTIVTLFYTVHHIFHVSGSSASVEEVNADRSTVAIDLNRLFSIVRSRSVKIHNTVTNMVYWSKSL
jgi:hypothetical protein